MMQHSHNGTDSLFQTQHVRLHHDAYLRHGAYLHH
ncbi:Putative uncharacterized protein, partial [Moritella viscosa]